MPKYTTLKRDYDLAFARGQINTTITNFKSYIVDVDFWFQHSPSIDIIDLNKRLKWALKRNALKKPFSDVNFILDVTMPPYRQGVEGKFSFGNISLCIKMEEPRDFRLCNKLEQELIQLMEFIVNWLIDNDYNIKKNK